MQPIGKTIVLLGVVLVLVGLVLWLAGDKLGWFGHLPGDMRLERKNVRFYAPFMSMLLLSILVSLVFWLFRRFF